MPPALTRRDALALAALLPSAPALAASPDRPDLAGIFRDHGASGTFALVDGATGEATISDARRAGRRLVPASTFKIPNSLIAFETGAVADADTVLPYGGGRTSNPAWARDMSLRDAMPISNVPIFQEVARRVGLARYRDWLAKLDYGNRDPGTVVDRFWLDGPLRISATEEARFNLRLAQKGLPASQRAQTLVHDIVRLETADGATLYGKTGWFVKRGETSVGWWTGWVERGSRIHAFTLNMDMPQMAMAPQRLEIGRAALKRLGIYG
ncbi:class D beta-lactamase [Phreatobacter cathodiphilus]|uniref:Beta-lactamase n=1 Tax=Phreatobacter cathodiphilus TaxID=1868589 RepID=A0A2S0N8D1_9HYPH|nr:class D beta-lactamase [Phreatobacter cathodiphilus]AVO44191.1 class D beta-lactamase [Phreatobacter cathodiphilus]